MSNGVQVRKETADEGIGNKKAYSVAQTAKVLGIGRNAAYQMVRDGIIPSFRISTNRIIIPISALDDWLSEQARAGRA